MKLLYEYFDGIIKEKCFTNVEKFEIKPTKEEIDNPAIYEKVELCCRVWHNGKSELIFGKNMKFYM